MYTYSYQSLQENDSESVNELLKFLDAKSQCFSKCNLGNTPVSIT